MKPDSLVSGGVEVRTIYLKPADSRVSARHPVQGMVGGLGSQLCMKYTFAH